MPGSVMAMDEQEGWQTSIRCSGLAQVVGKTECNVLQGPMPQAAGAIDSSGRDHHG